MQRTEPTWTTDLIVAITTGALYDVSGAITEVRADYLAELFGEMLAKKYVADLRRRRGTS